MFSSESANPAVKPSCSTNASRMNEKEFRNTEYFVFEGDRIRQINVYFGAAYKYGAFVKSP